MLVGTASVSSLNYTRWRNYTFLERSHILRGGPERAWPQLLNPSTPDLFGWWPSPFLKAMRSSTLTGKWLTGNWFTCMVLLNHILTTPMTQLTFRWWLFVKPLQGEWFSSRWCMCLSLPPFCGLRRNEVLGLPRLLHRYFSIYRNKSWSWKALLYERWDFLCKLEMVEEGAFVIGREEVLTEEELAVTLKVKCSKWVFRARWEERWPGQSTRNAADRPASLNQFQKHASIISYFKGPMVASRYCACLLRSSERV